jgi:hypothetical protein
MNINEAGSSFGSPYLNVGDVYHFMAFWKGAKISWRLQEYQHQW